MCLREPSLKPEIHHRPPATRHMGKKTDSAPVEYEVVLTMRGRGPAIPTRMDTFLTESCRGQTDSSRVNDCRRTLPVCSPRNTSRVATEKIVPSRVGLVTSGARAVSTVSDATPANMTRRKGTAARDGKRRLMRR